MNHAMDRMKSSGVNMESVLEYNGHQSKYMYIFT